MEFFDKIIGIAVIKRKNNKLFNSIPGEGMGAILKMANDIGIRNIESISIIADNAFRPMVMINGQPAGTISMEMLQDIRSGANNRSLSSVG